MTDSGAIKNNIRQMTGAHFAAAVLALFVVAATLGYATPPPVGRLAVQGLHEIWPHLPTGGLRTVAGSDDALRWLFAWEAAMLLNFAAGAAIAAWAGVLGIRLLSRSPVAILDSTGDLLAFGMTILFPAAYGAMRAFENPPSGRPVLWDLPVVACLLIAFAAFQMPVLQDYCRRSLERRRHRRPDRSLEWTGVAAAALGVLFYLRR